LLVGHHPIPLRQLNHVTTTNKVESIWNANLKVSKSITIDKVLTKFGGEMMDYVGVEESMDAT